MCMSVCVCQSMCQRYACMHIHMWIHIFLYLYTLFFIYIHVRVCMYVRVRVHVGIHVNATVWAWYVCVCVPESYVSIPTQQGFMCIRVCMCMCSKHTYMRCMHIHEILLWIYAVKNIIVMAGTERKTTKESKPKKKSALYICTCVHMNSVCVYSCI